MQEIRQDDSIGETHVEDTIEELIPHIKKSLANPKVKYVKIFSAAKGPEKFRAEEEKKAWFDSMIEEIPEEDFEKRMKEKMEQKK